MGSSTDQQWFDNRMLMLDYLINNQDKFKFKDYKKFILRWIITYGSLSLNFESPQEKSENAKCFFRIVGSFLDDKNLILSDEDQRKINEIKDLIPA